LLKNNDICLFTLKSSVFSYYNCQNPDSATSLKNLRILFLLLGLSIWSSCSVKKYNFVSCNYHGTITHYNFYYNARERMKQGEQTLYDGTPDKYDRVLSIFKYGDLAQAKGVFPDMDEAIKKVSIAITRNSMVVKGKHDNKTIERNRWIDDCYLLIGKCQFYKQDYWTAIETFQYTSSEYKDSPIRPIALLWLTKTYLELGKVSDAVYLLDYLKNDKKFPVELKGEYNAVLAQYHWLRNDIPRTIEALAAASATTVKKDDRARYNFILGQLYQKQGFLDSAFTAYQKVIKLNPPYELAFNARISRARCYDVKSGSGDIVKRELNKMLKDEKNKEYQDQIYYALAGVARQEKYEPLAIEYLNKSLHAGVGNTAQSALNYLELADIYLKRPEYMPAAAYFDSCLTNLSKEHPDYNDIEEKRNSLDRLVRNLKVIILEDSLQSLASLSPEERKAKIDSLISYEKAQKERIDNAFKLKQKLEEDKIIEEKQLKSEPRSLTPGGITTQGSWYFYNQATISFGYNEFLKKWGTRKLEDNWRRSEKEFLGEGSSATEGNSLDSLSKKYETVNDSISKLDEGQRKEAYLNQLPTSPQQIKESNIKIIEAYYNVGIIYREQLSNYTESVKSFETMDMRFPQNKYKLPSYYNLYRTYLLMQDTVKANFYKNYLLTNYPESEYTKLILNPNYFKEIQKKTAVLEVFYENTFRSYQNQQYDLVISRKSEAEELFPANKLAGKFAFLKALAIGKTKPVDDFVLSLEDVVRTYPKDSVSISAKEILDYIKNRGNVTEVSLPEVVDSSSLFTFKPLSPQYFMILYKNSAVNTTEVIAKLKAFNTVNHQFENYAITNGNLDLTYQYISVLSFKNKEIAMIYYNEVLNEEGLLSNIKEDRENKFLIISQDNLLQLSRNKSIDAYNRFFQKNYVQ